MRKEDIIRSEAKEFYESGDWKNKQIFPTAQDLYDDLKLELHNHQIDGQIIYLEEVIRLIDIDAQKHFKTCKKKDNPSECTTHQFYAKSKYYTNQFLDSIADKNESVNTKYELNQNLSQETLSVIEDLIDGKRFTLTKDRPEEISAIIGRLHSLGFLKKVTKHSYALEYGNLKYLAKLVEFQSWNEFKNWLNNEKSSSEASITNNFYESSVGQLNQAVAGSIIKNAKSKTHEFSKTSWLNKLYWVIGIILSLIVIYEFVLKQFVK